MGMCPPRVGDPMTKPAALLMASSTSSMLRMRKGDVKWRCRVPTIVSCKFRGQCRLSKRFSLVYGVVSLRLV